jgi:hypothetical protein
MMADARDGPPLNILLLCNRPARSAEASTVTDHLDAFLKYSRHRVHPLSFIRELPSAIDLTQFDAVVIHYTVAIGYLSDHYISPASKQRVSDFRGLKTVFVQDEYRAVNKVHEALRFMGIHLLFTCVPDGEVARVYPEAALPGVTKVTNLTGYVPDSLVHQPVPPITERPIDVGYRTRKPPYWLGELGFEKWDIADRFAAHARESGLHLDLSYHEADRLYGTAWTRFIAQCKAMLGVESGASVFDFEGTLQSRVDEYVAAHPAATFHGVQEKFLKPYEKLIRLNQISPRCFEAAALRTSMVLYEGEYSGILKPGRHYVPLRKDFGNFVEVLEVLRDTAALQRIAHCAYEEVARNDAYSYRSFMRKFDDAMDAEFARRSFAPSARYSMPRYAAQIAMSPAYLVHRGYSRALQWLLLGTPLRRVIFRIWGRVPLSVRQIVRPLFRLIGR